MTSTYYLTVNENIGSGLLNSQVVKPILNNTKHNIKLISISNLLSKKVGVEGIECVNIPTAVPGRLYVFHPLFFFLVPFISFFYSLLLIPIVSTGDRIVSRSYIASLVTYFLKKVVSIDFIFDTRSLFVDESVAAGRIKENSNCYKMWRYIETKLLLSADKVIAVSRAQADYYCSILGGDEKVQVVPCFMKARLNVKDKSRVNRITSKIRQDQDTVLVGYYGSMNEGWNNVGLYSEFFEKSLGKNVKVVILSQDYKSLLKDSRLKKANIFVVNTDDLEEGEVEELLSLCDYGVILMKKSLDWKTRLGVKFVSYLNLGLKVIVGEFVGEAARYSREIFPHRTLIYSTDSRLNLTKRVSNFSEDKGILEKYFGPENINKYFD